MKRIGYAIIAGAVMASLPLGRVAAQGQTQEPTQGQAPAVIFRAAVDYVEIDATVTDADGRVVTDLTREDFEVTEGGHPQTIDAFSYVALPTTPVPPEVFAAHPVEADVQQNGSTEGRVYVFLIDDLHIEASRTLRARAIAKEFLTTQFRPHDLGAVLFTSGSGRAGQDLTSDRRLLLAGVDRFIGERAPSATQQKAVLRTPMPSNRPPTASVIIPSEPGSGEVHPDDMSADATADRRTLTTLRETTEFLAGVRGRRKAILFFSEGLDTDLGDVMGSKTSMLRLEMLDAIAAATRGNVRYYPVDPRGLDSMDMMPEVASLSGGRIGLRANEIRAAKDGLQSLAMNTGGVALLNRNSLTTGYAQIVSENSSYFVLGYSSTNDRQDGKFRKVSVKVKRPGLRVQARGGYYASRRREKTETATDTAAGVASGADATRLARPLSVEALSNPLGLSGIPIRMFAAAFRPPHVDDATGTHERESSHLADVTTAAELDVSRFTLTPRAGEAPEQVEVSVLATNVNGTVTTGLRQGAPLSLSPAAAERVRANRLRVLSHLSLAPGRYQIRLASTVAGTAGSVVYDLDVPDFFTAPLSMSGIVITSDAATDTVTLLDTAHPLALSGPPVATRRFTADEELSLLVELYEQADAPRHAIELVLELQAENGDIVKRIVERRQADDELSASGGQDFTPSISLHGLAPGPYLLHVEGRADGLRAPVTRDIQIDIVP